MAINKRFTQLNNSGSNHNLLDAYSGKITGSFEVTGAAHFPGGLSGSLTTLENGSPFIIGTGTITVTSVSNGAITINGTATSVPEYFYSATNDIIEASGSLYVSGAMRALSLSASNGAEISGSVLVDLSQGPNFSFVISGSGNGLPAFDVVSPGTIPGEEHSMFVVDPTNNRVRALSLDPSNYINMELGTPALQVISGVHQIDLNPNFDRIAFFVSASAATGSISVIDDNSNIGELQLEATTLNLYINGLAISGDPGVAGYALTSSGPGVAPGWAPFPTPPGESQPELYYVAGTDPNGTAATSGSLVVSGALVVTGAVEFSPAGTGRGLLNFGGLDIGPITGSLTLTGATQTGYAVGDVLSASNGAGPDAVVEHEMHVLAVGALINSSGIVEHFFSATYLVTSKIDNAGIQSIIGSVELTRESSGSFVNQWDVNVESDMKVALTGTMNNNSLNEVRWFVERTRERSKKW